MLTVGSLFTGYGGYLLALKSIFPEVRVQWVSDKDKSVNKVLAHRYPDVPNLGDISKIEWMPDHRVDMITGGFPCQDVSLAGVRRGLGQQTRTGLWYEVLRCIATLNPTYVALENVRGLFSARADRGGDLRALGAVLWDLAESGYDAEWRSVRAFDAGLPQRRERVFILAWRRDYAAYPEHLGRGSS